MISGVFRRWQRAAEAAWANRSSAQEGVPREEDVAVNPAVANTRATGGEPDRSQPDQHSTTGTTPNETFVGRVSGQDVGYAEETGAERRSAVDPPDDQAGTQQAGR